MPGDREALKRFSCGQRQPWTPVIEQWIQGPAYGWSRPNASKHNCLRLMVTKHEDVMGLYAFEPGVVRTEAGVATELDPDTQPVIEWFVRLVAIEESFQGNDLGLLLLENCLEHVSEVEPDGGAYWKVDAGNVASHRMSELVGARGVDVSPDGTTEYVIYF